MAERANSIEVEGLVREFKKGPRAVDGIDLHVEPGEIYGFLGPNGAGKSTTVLMLTTLLPPTAGTARVGGYDVVTEGPKVRSVIGAALQEAALDPMLTGRDHLRLQATLQGISRAERKPRGAGAARPRRPQRGGRPQGRRLLGRDEAAARPRARARAPAADPLPRRADDRARHPEPHRALGRGRAARARGRRHRLPDDAVPRGGRRARGPGRDHRPRPHRRRGDAARAEGRDRPAERRRDPARRTPTASGSSPRSRPSASRSTAAPATSPSGCARGWPGSPGVVRALDDEGLTLAHLELQAPSLDDVFLAKTGRSLEGAGEDEPDAAETARVSAVAAQVGALARRSVVRTSRQPAAVVFPLIFPMLLLLVNSGGLQASTNLPGFPTDSFLAFALAVPFIQGALFSTMNAGTDLARDIQTGFLNRLSLTSMRGSALLAGLLGGRGRARPHPGVVLHRASACSSASTSRPARSGSSCSSSSRPSISVSFGALGVFLALRTGSGEAIQGLFPLLFVFLFLSSMNTPRNLIAVDWFRFVATSTRSRT